MCGVVVPQQCGALSLLSVRGGRSSLVLVCLVPVDLPTPQAALAASLARAQERNKPVVPMKMKIPTESLPDNHVKFHVGVHAGVCACQAWTGLRDWIEGGKWGEECALQHTMRSTPEGAWKPP